MYLLLAVLLCLLLLGFPYGGGPGWHAMGYWPSGAVGVVLIVVLIFVLVGGVR